MVLAVVDVEPDVLVLPKLLVVVLKNVVAGDVNVLRYVDVTDIDVVEFVTNVPKVFDVDVLVVEVVDFELKPVDVSLVREMLDVTPVAVVKIEVGKVVVEPKLD